MDFENFFIFIENEQQSYLVQQFFFSQGIEWRDTGTNISQLSNRQIHIVSRHKYGYPGLGYCMIYGYAVKPWTFAQFQVFLRKEKLNRIKQ